MQNSSLIPKVIYDAADETWHVDATVYYVEQQPSGLWNRVWREGHESGTFKEGLAPYVTKEHAQKSLKRLLRESGAIQSRDSNVIVTNLPKGRTAKQVLASIDRLPNAVAEAKAKELTREIDKLKAELLKKLQ